MAETSLLYKEVRLPLAFLALLLIGFVRTYLIALRWWYWVTQALLGFLSNLAFLRALFWTLSSTSYSQLIFLIYLLNTLPLATSMLMTSRLMSMVLLLNLNIYFSRLIPQVAENAAARALSEAKPLAWRRPTPKACRRAKSRGREGI